MPSTNDIARLCVGTASRIPRLWRHGAIAGAAVLAALMLMGLDLSGATSSEGAAVPGPAPEVATPCQQQTWPHIGDACLRQAAEQPARGARQVRVISLDRDAPTTVQAAVQASVHAVPSPPASAARSDRAAKNGTQSARESRKVTVQDGRKPRRDRNPRVFEVPAETPSRSLSLAVR
jgi:hypothetical protein